MDSGIVSDNRKSDGDGTQSAATALDAEIPAAIEDRVACLKESRLPEVAACGLLPSGEEVSTGSPLCVTET